MTLIRHELAVLSYLRLGRLVQKSVCMLNNALCIIIISFAFQRAVYQRLWNIIQRYYDCEDVHMERRVSEYYVERRWDPLCAFIE